MQAKAEGMQAAEAARAAAVAPLQAEVSRLTERVHGLQKLHTTELAAIEVSARQQAAAAQAEAQAALDRLGSAGAAVRRERDATAARAEGLATQVTRLQVWERVGGLRAWRAPGNGCERSTTASCMYMDGPEQDFAFCDTRPQDELAKHTQRAASTIELQTQELGMLKGRIR